MKPFLFSLAALADIFLLFLSPSMIQSRTTYDICDRIIDPSVDDLRRGVVFSIATGNLDALTVARFPKCTAALKFAIDSNERTELSVYSAPKVQVCSVFTEMCINMEWKLSDGARSASEASCGCTQPSRKILETWEKLGTLDIDVYEQILTLKPLLDFKIFIQVVNQTQEHIFIYTTGVLRFELGK